MKIIAVYFERKAHYKKLLTVFEKSAAKIMPDIEVEILKIPMPKNIDHKRDTAFAFLAAAEYALKSKECLAIADVDLMFTRSIADVFKIPFDIAVTIHTIKKRKYNTGLWFYRPTDNAREFLKEWINKTIKIKAGFNNKYKNIGHGGIDQAALYFTDQNNKKANIKELLCQEWNSTQYEWRNIDRNTRVIHIKSKLMLATFDRIEIPKGHEYMKPIIKKWRSYL